MVLPGPEKACDSSCGSPVAPVRTETQYNSPHARYKLRWYRRRIGTTCAGRSLAPCYGMRGTDLAYGTSGCRTLSAVLS
eukprot:1320891-Rhodomonas_salina.1